MSIPEEEEARNDADAALIEGRDSPPAFAGKHMILHVLTRLAGEPHVPANAYLYWSCTKMDIDSDVGLPHNLERGKCS